MKLGVIALMGVFVLFSGFSAQAAQATASTSGFAGNFLIAQAADSRNDWATAEQAYAQAAQADAASSDLNQRRLVLLLNLGQMEPAFALSRGLSTAGVETQLIHLVNLIAAVKANDLEQARKDLRKITTADLGRYLKPYLQAWLASSENARQQALAPLTRIKGMETMLEHQKTLLRPHSGLAPALSVQQGIAEVLRELCGLMHDDAAATTLIPYLQLALALDGENRDIRQRLGDLLVQANALNMAEAHYIYLQNQTSDEQITLRRAALDGLRDKPEDALARLQPLLGQSDNLAAWSLTADIHAQNGQAQEAVAAYSNALESKQLSPYGRARLLFLRAIQYHKLNQSDTAEDDLRASLKLQPDEPDRLNFLGYMWAEQGIHLTEADEMISKALKLDPNNPNIIDSLGWVRFHQGDMAQAVRLLEMAASQLPYNSVVNDHLGDAYWAAGRQTEARYQWQRALTYHEGEDAASLSVEDIRQKLANGPSLPTLSRHD